MISCDNGIVKLDGEVVEIFADLTCMIVTIHEAVAEQSNEDYAGDFIIKSLTKAMTAIDKRSL